LKLQDKMDSIVARHFPILSTSLYEKSGELMSVFINNPSKNANILQVEL